MPHVVLQPTTYMENLLGPWTAPEVAEKDTFAYPTPNEVGMQWVATEDVAAFAVEAIRNPDVADANFEVCGPERLHGEDVAERFGAALGREVSFRPMPPEEFGGIIDKAFPGMGEAVTQGYRMAYENPRGVLDGRRCRTGVGEPTRSVDESGRVGTPQSEGIREKRGGRMRLAVFGASGRTGRPLVEQALAAGHEVTAFVRDLSKLSMSHERLTVVEGDVKEYAKVQDAITGADAVLSVLGHTKSSAKDVQTMGTENIVAAMEESSVRRLVSLTGAGVGDPEDEPKLFDRAITGLLKLLQKDMLEDAEGHARVIEKSGLDWTIVRGPMLTEGEKKGEYRVGYVGKNSGTKISRADVADFMLRQVADDTYLGQKPMVSY